MLSERVIGKKAWVTGAAHGIGRASAWALAEAGADVAISDINDITKENEIEETINTIVDKWGKLDIAYCNAGTFQDIPAEDMPLEEFERVIKVNLTGAFISSRAAGKAMIKQKSGSIILTASMSGHIVNIPQCQCAYNSSKAGVILLGKSLAIEWAKHGIRVNTVSPGYIRTWSDEPLKPEEVGQYNFEQWTPLKRFGAASEIAGIIVYLASEESSFVTGSDFVVDGGYTAF